MSEYEYSFKQLTFFNKCFIKLTQIIDESTNGVARY